MCGAILPCDGGIIASQKEGRAEVSFERRGEDTVVGHLFQQAPLRVLFPRGEEPNTPLAAIVTTSGGLVGGDVLRVGIHLGRGASATVMSGAAEKIYRSRGDVCRVLVDVSIREGARLDYLPHETIVFRAARLDRKTIIDIAAGCRVVASGMVVFGRTASGEALTEGHVRDAWEIRKDGRLLWADALLLDGEMARTLAAPACLGGAVALATMIFAADDAVMQLPLARELLDVLGNDDDVLRSGATVVAGLLVVRWMSADAHRLRTAFGAFLADFRRRAAGRGPSLPRLWWV